MRQSARHIFAFSIRIIKFQRSPRGRSFISSTRMVHARTHDSGWRTAHVPYNTVADSFRKKKLCSRLFFQESIILLRKTIILRFWAPFGEERGAYRQR